MSYVPSFARDAIDTTRKLGGYVASAARDVVEDVGDAVEGGVEKARAYIPAIERGVVDNTKRFIEGGIPAVKAQKEPLPTFGLSLKQGIANRERQFTDIMPGREAMVQARNEMEEDFPWDDNARGQILDIDWQAARKLESGHEHQSEGMKTAGNYEHEGDGIRKFLHRFLPENVARWAGNRKLVNMIDDPTVRISDEANDKTDTAAHEALHYMFDRSIMGRDSKEGEGRELATKAWISTWDELKANDPDIAPLLEQIDEHLDEGGYDSANEYSRATERFAYLGQLAKGNGGQVIPNELKQFYHGVIKGMPKPSGDFYEKPRSIIDKITGRSEYERLPAEGEEAEDTAAGILEAIAHNETRGIEPAEAYGFSKPSGSKAMGDDLGKYQVTEGELKSFGEQFLGEVPTKEEFLASPDMQDNYMSAKVQFLRSEGLTDEEILAVHAQGMTGWGDKGKLAKKIQDADTHRSGYVKRGIEVVKNRKKKQP